MPEPPIPYDKDTPTASHGEDEPIDWASFGEYFDWRFRTDSDDVFAIRISVTVEWAEWVGGLMGWSYPGYETEVSLVISIANYWQ